MTPSIKDVVKEKYGQAALRIATGGSSCCGASAALENCCDPITSNLYDSSQAGELPEAALKASLGCGNPTLLAALNPGETVLDLGSGGGIDVLLSARGAIDRIVRRRHILAPDLIHDRIQAETARIARACRANGGRDCGHLGVQPRAHRNRYRERVQVIRHICPARGRDLNDACPKCGSRGLVFVADGVREAQIFLIEEKVGYAAEKLLRVIGPPIE